jgi:hypothetical protein
MRIPARTHLQHRSEYRNVHLNALTLLFTLVILESFSLSFAIIIIYRLAFYPLGGM